MSNIKASLKIFWIAISRIYNLFFLKTYIDLNPFCIHDLLILEGNSKDFYKNSFLLQSVFLTLRLDNETKKSLRKLSQDHSGPVNGHPRDY